MDQPSAPRVDASVIDALYKKCRINRKTYFNASYGTTPGTLSEYNCHFLLSGKVNRETVWSSYKWEPFLTEEVARAWATFLVSPASPWYEVVVSKQHAEFANVDRIIDGGFVFDNTDVPSNALVNFLIATRAARKYPEFVVNWYNLVYKYNIHPRFALLFMYSPSPNIPLGGAGHRMWYNTGVEECNPVTGTDKYVSPYCDCGSWFLNHYRMTEEGVMNLVLGRMTNLLPSYKDKANYAPCNIIWGNDGSSLKGARGSNDYVKVEHTTYFAELIQRYGLSSGKAKRVFWTHAASQYQDVPQIDEPWDEMATVIRAEQERLGIVVTKEQVCA